MLRLWYTVCVVLFRFIVIIINIIIVLWMVKETISTTLRLCLLTPDPKTACILLHFYVPIVISTNPYTGLDIIIHLHNKISSVFVS